MRVTTSSARSGALALQMFDGHAQAVRPVAREPVRVSGEYPGACGIVRAVNAATEARGALSRPS